LWRYHVATQLIGGEFSFRPFDRWIWDDIGTVLMQMITVAGKKGGYFGLMIVATFVAVVGFIRGASPLTRLATIISVVFWIWNIFLLVSYLGSFSEGEGRTVASYWRYNTQLGGAAMVFAAYGAALLWRRFVPWQPGRIAPIVICALIVVAPAFSARIIDFDRVPPKAFVRSAAQEVARLVPQGSVVGTADPADNGEYSVFLRYALYRIGHVQHITGIDWALPDAIAHALEGSSLTHLWVRGPGRSIVEVLHLPLRSDATYLLERTPRGWRVLKEWPAVA
jgi:hypothetical protein